MSESLAEALDRLARAGFVRRFEPDGDALWCASCDVWVGPEQLVVEEVVEVARGEGDGHATLYALRCAGCGANGVWVVTDPAAVDPVLLEALGGARSLPPGDRLVAPDGS